MNFEITYSLEEKDILTYQLYYASKNMASSKFRKIRDILVPFFCISIGLLSNELYPRITGITYGILWFIAYPSFEKWFYKKRCIGDIAENYKDYINKSTTIDLNKERLLQKLSETERSFPINLLIEVTELSDIIIMRIKNETPTIIPKDKIKALNTFTSELKELCLKTNIPYKEDTAWIW